MAEGSHRFKTGIFYSQRISEKEYNVARIENALIERLQEDNIRITKCFSDFGYRNLHRPGLNSLIQYLINTDHNIDVVVFYSFDHLDRDKRRLHFVLPRIKRLVNEIVRIKNITDYHEIATSKPIIIESVV